MNPPLFLADPVIQSSLLPLAVALAFAGLLRLAGGPGRGAYLAGAAIGFGFIAAYAAIVGLPQFPPRGSVQKIFYLASAGLALGFALDLARNPRPAVLAALAAFPSLSLWWLAAPRLQGLGDGGQWLRLGVLVVAALVVLLRLHRRSDDGLTAPVMLFAAALGTGAIALLGASASISQSAFALAAALGGFMVWNWPRCRFRFGSAALFGGGGVLVMLAGQMVFFTRANADALSLLLIVFFADLAMARIRTGPGVVGGALRPVILGLICMIPVVLAVAFAYVTTSGSGTYLG